MTPEQRDAIVARHTAGHTDNPRRDYCQADNQDWPCDTIRIADAGPLAGHSFEELIGEAERLSDRLGAVLAAIRLYPEREMRP